MYSEERAEAKTIMEMVQPQQQQPENFLHTFEFKCERMKNKFDANTCKVETVIVDAVKH